MKTKWVLLLLCLPLLLCGRADALFKNQADQTITVNAYDTSGEAWKTGDAAQITAQISLDAGVSAATNDVNPTELEATDQPGVYVFDLTQAETNADMVVISAVSSTGNVWINPITFYTRAAIQDANVVLVLDDATAPINFRDQYNEVGISGDNFPATQAQLGSIANTGAAINAIASDALTTFGAQTNTYTATNALDGVYHVLTEDTGDIDIYYEFSIGGNGVPVSATISGRLFDPPATNDVISIQAWDYVAADWTSVGTLDGINSAVDSVKTVILFGTHLTAANSGIVRIRFVDTTLGLNTALYIDLMYCSYSVQGSAVGYANGAIWIDTLFGTAGNVPYFNGTADRAVDNLTDALSLSQTIGLRHFQVVSGSTVNLIANASTMVGRGENWHLGLEGQIITSATVIGAHVEGSPDASSVGVKFIDSHFGAVVGAVPGVAIRCGLQGLITLLAPGTYVLDACRSEVAGTGTPCLDWGVSIGTTAVNFRHWSGGIEIENMQAGDTMSLEGDGQLIINANCTGGAIAIRGNFDVSRFDGGAVTLSDDARYSITQIQYADIREINGTSARAVDLAKIAEFLIANDAEPLSDNIAENSIIANMMGIDATLDGYDNTTDPLEAISSRIGTPVALDGGAATLGAMLAKLADDNDGADFDAETDSLTEFRDSIPTVEESGLATTNTVNFAHAATDADISTAQDDLDILTGTDGATLATLQPNYAPATSASLATHDGKLDTVDTNVDTLLTRATEARLVQLDPVWSGTCELNVDPSFVEFDDPLSDNPFINDDFYKFYEIRLVSGPYSPQTRTIEEYRHPQKYAKVTVPFLKVQPFPIIPGDTYYEIWPGSDSHVSNILDDVITAAVYDASTAFPLASVDSGATQVARTGADADTLETVSDQIDSVLVDTNRVDALIEDSSGDRYTAKALEQAPSGGGGDPATGTKQDEIIAELALIEGAGFDTSTHSLVAILTRGDIAWITAETAGGSFISTVTLTNQGAPLADCRVEVYTERTKINQVASRYTDNFGKAVFYLDAGTYYLWRKKSGLTFTTDPVEWAVSD
jgi:hypothetical protein